MEDIIIVAILVVILGVAALYIYRAKKKGKKCIGCPDGGSCANAGNGGCSCGCSDKTE